MTITAESARTDSRMGREGRPATILTCADPGWDEARQAWNMAVDQRPAAVAVPESAQDVAEAVRFARERGLRVAAQGTGHNAGPLGDLADTVLIKTHAMRGLVIDPAARIARAEAGVIWQQVTDAAAEHGLAGLAGSSPDVGVVGYTLGGGMSWLGRTYGLSANNVEAFELVTADGRLVRADAEHEPDLFWALRGGGGSFAVVTAVELRLFPVTEAYAGLLWYPVEQASEVLHAWRELTSSGLPDAFTTTARLETSRPSPTSPSRYADSRSPSSTSSTWARRPRPMRCWPHCGPSGRSWTRSARSPRRPWATCTWTPSTRSPPRATGCCCPASRPRPSTSSSRWPARPSSPLLVAELRHLGGEMRRTRPQNGALAAIDADYVLFAAGMTPVPEAARAVSAAVAAVTSAMTPWAARQMYLNFAETSQDPARFWSPHVYHRLRRIKAAADPRNLIRANHPIPPAR